MLWIHTFPLDSNIKRICFAGKKKMITISYLLICLFISITTPEERLCIKYKTLLSKGTCEDVIKDRYVFQTKTEADRADFQMRIIFNEFATVLDFINYQLTNPVETYFKFLQRICPDKETLKNITQEFVKIANLTIIKTCVKNHKWFSCMTHHPICLENSDEDTILSPPCKDSCITSLYPECKHIVSRLLPIVDYIHRMCPNKFINFGIRLLLSEIESCESAPTADHSKLEKCQMSQQNVYNGTVNETKTAKSCIQWSTFPLLTKNNYRGLDENYCRNPQGIGDEPWCYIHTNGSWEYCDVIELQPKIEDAVMIAIAISAGVFLILVSLTIFYVKKHIRPSKKSDMMEIEPYLSSSIENAAFYISGNVSSHNSNRLKDTPAETTCKI